MRQLAAVPVFFTLRIATALLLLKLSASFLAVGDFAVFAQLMAFAALLNLIAVGGTQNGLIRQAAAAGDIDALATVQGAALTIWAIALPVIAGVVALASGQISILLTGRADRWGTVIVLALIALAAGPGQIWCSILSGRKSTTASLSAQATGLLAGTGLAAWSIIHHQAALAAIGFASGSLVTMTAAFALAGPVRSRLVAPSAAMAEARALLRYSAAIAATAASSAIILFGLRSFYRTAFGPAALGYWLAANRISDMSTQLIGLFMLQYFVPHLTMIEDQSARRRFVLRCGLAGAAAMGSAIVIFSLASRPLVHLFLSDAFLPAIPAIRTYMAGDFLRVWASLGMFAAFAAGKPGRYALIEISTLVVMAIITIALVRAGDPGAPQQGYLGAYAITVMGLAAFQLRRKRP